MIIALKCYPQTQNILLSHIRAPPTTHAELTAQFSASFSSRNQTDRFAEILRDKLIYQK